MTLFTSLQEDKEKNLFKTDLVGKKDEVITVCVHHKSLILNRYEVLQK